VRARRRSAAPWLVVPALLSVGVVGAKQWSKGDPLVAGVHGGAAGGARRVAWFDAVTAGRAGPREAGSPLGGASLGDRNWHVPQSLDVPVSPFPRPVGRVVPAEPVGPPEELPSRVSEPSGGAPGLSGPDGGRGPADTSGACRELGAEFGRAANAVVCGAQQHAICVGAEQRVTVRGEGVVPHEVVELVQQMGPGPWEVDLRYRGLIVIREEAP
jgi:hypothetical protein